MEDINNLFINHPNALSSLLIAAGFVGRFPALLRESILVETKSRLEKVKEIVKVVFPGDLLDRYDSRPAIWTCALHLEILPAELRLFGVIYFILKDSEEASVEVRELLVDIAQAWLRGTQDSDGRLRFKPCLDDWCTRWYDMKLGIPATPPRLDPPSLRRSSGDDLPLQRTKRVRAAETEGGGEV